MPGLVKIGYSTKDPSLRAEELHTTGLPHAFEVVYDVLVVEPRDVEQQTHSELKDCHEAKEFFRADVGKAVAAVRAVIEKQGKTVLLESTTQNALLEVTQAHKCAMYGMYGCTDPALPGSNYCKRHTR